MSLFVKIISEIENINQLLSLEEIYKELELRVGEENYDYEADKLVEEWHETKITLKDGTVLELIDDRRCILHNFKYYEGMMAYKVKGENLYVCADCLTICKEYDELVEKYYDYCYDKLLIPKSWDENGIINWLRNQNKREEEYLERKISYNYYSNDENKYDDWEEEFDSYEDFLKSENDYYEQVKTENKKKELRNKTWKTEECQQLYNDIVSYVNKDIELKKSQLTLAKNLAIENCINKIETNFESFKLSIEVSNEKHMKKVKIKEENLTKINNLKYAVVNHGIFRILSIGKANRKGTSVHLELEGSNIYLVSFKKLFCSLEDAEEYYKEEYK